MKRKKVFVSLGIFCLLLSFLVAACGKSSKKEDYTAQNTELKKLIPSRTGYNWVYNGFAEYGHSLELKSVETGEGETVYHLAGEVYDASGGEAKGDFSLSVDYIIKNGSLFQKKAGERMMDTFNEIELLRAPLKEETQWEQKLKDSEGKEYQLVCTITGINEEKDGKVYSVSYQDKNSDFFEKRKIEEGTGIIQFEKIWQNQGESIEMGYFLNTEASGYYDEKTLTSFLPSLNKQLTYYGLAEYSHVGTLARVSETGRESIYRFNGSFRDGSGIPGDFKIDYIFDYQAGTVQEKVLENTRSEKKEINSKLHDPILIKLPLEVGNTWQQEIYFEGQKKLMTAQIVGIVYPGRTFYSQMKQEAPVMTVRYMVENTPGYFQETYVEERTFQKGRGMTGYSQLMKGDLGISEKTEEYEIDNIIVNNMFGYGLNRE